jgi:hypothetical protein
MRPKADIFAYEYGDSGGSTTMKKIISASFLAVLALTMLLPVAQQVNASSVNHPILRQGTAPMPGSGGGGH